MSSTAVVSSQMVGLSTSDRRDEEGCIYIPCSLSEGSRRPSGLSGFQGEGKEIGRDAYSVPYIMYCIMQLS